MPYVAGGLVAIVWLWFWLRGHWFAALIGALALGWFPLIDDKRSTEWALCLACLVVPWVPMMAWAAYRRVRRDLAEAFPADAKFSESLSLELRDPR